MFIYCEHVPKVDDFERSVADRLRAVGLDPQPTGTGTDLVVRVPGPTGMTTVVVELKRSVQPPSEQVHTHRSAEVVMVAREHIGAGAGRQLRERGTPYVDSVGNMWLDLPGLHIEIEGRQPPPSPRSAPATSRAFRPSGLRLIFLLLCWPGHHDGPLRELAQLSGISLGAAQGAVTDLEAEGFVVIGTDRVRRLVDTARLVQRWLSLYPTRLRPKLQGLALTGPEPAWWTARPGERVRRNVQLSGEAAMAELHSSIRPETTTLWGRPPWGAARQYGRLITDGEPNTFLIERFWDESLDRDRSTVPALLIYADALMSGEPRQIEVAEEFWRADADLRRLASR